MPTEQVRRIAETMALDAESAECLAGIGRML
jgi:hypothetical protein